GVRLCGACQTVGHANPSPSGSRCGPKPGSPRKIGARPAALTSSQLAKAPPAEPVCEVPAEPVAAEPVSTADEPVPAEPEGAGTASAVGAARRVSPAAATLTVSRRTFMYSSMFCCGGLALESPNAASTVVTTHALVNRMTPICRCRPGIRSRDQGRDTRVAGFGEFR